MYVYITHLLNRIANIYLQSFLKVIHANEFNYTGAEGGKKSPSARFVPYPGIFLSQTLLLLVSQRSFQRCVGHTHPCVLLNLCICVYGVHTVYWVCVSLFCLCHLTMYFGDFPYYAYRTISSFFLTTQAFIV